MDHPDCSIEIGFKALVPCHLIEQVVEIGDDEGPHGHIIKRVQSIHQMDPLQLHSLGFIGEHMLVQPIKDEVRMLMSWLAMGECGLYIFLANGIKSAKEVP